MSTVTEDIEAFLTLHNRYKAGTLPAEDLPLYHELRTRVQQALLQQTTPDDKPSNVLQMPRPSPAA